MPPPSVIDLDRMHRARVEKVRTAMAAAAIDTLVCCGQNNVAYLTGARVPAADNARAGMWRSVALLRADSERPELFTRFPEGAGSFPEVCDWVAAETRAGADALAACLPAGTLAIDDAPGPLWGALAGRELADAGTVLGPAKRVKSEDELACIRAAQAVNERAIDATRPLARAGVAATTLSGAFLRAVAELGAQHNTVDPVFQVMPPSVDGEVLYPERTRPDPLEAGDVVWVDTGINVHGYASDYGATWIVDRAPDATQAEQFDRWRTVVDRTLEVVRAGATSGDLVRAAGTDRGRTPWLSYFYLAHGIGTDSAEMPFVGTDLGTAFDDSYVLEPGMVLVFEPVIWDDGHAGHRSEEIVAVTATGYEFLSRRAELDEAGA